MRQRSDGVQYMISVFLILLAAAINYSISLVLTPYITKNIGTEGYGFVSLANNFANYISVITVAVNAVATRYITVEYHKNNFENANVYYSTLFFADITMSGFIIVVASIIVMNLEMILNIDTILVSDVKILFFMASVNICIVSIGTVFNSATLIKNRFDIASVFKIIAYISEAIVLVILFSWMEPHVQYVGVALAFSSMVLVMLNYIFGKQAVKELVISKVSFRISAIKDVFITGIWYSFNSLGNMLNSGLDLWVSNILLSALQMGQLAIVKTVTTIGTALYQLTAQPYQPILIRQYANNNKEKLISSLKLAIKTNGCLSNVLFAFLTIFGTNYYRLWTPTENAELLAGLTLISMIGTIIEGAVTPLYYVYVLTLKNKVPCFVTFVTGIINIISMYIFIKFFHMGLEVVVGTTTILSWAVNFLFTPTYVANCLGMKKGVFYSTLIRNIISAAIMVLMFRSISLLLNPQSCISLVAVAIICGGLGVILHFSIVLNREEWEVIKQYYFRIIKKEQKIK